MVRTSTRGASVSKLMMCSREACGPANMIRACLRPAGPQAGPPAA
jgi:hypothetical protein